MREYMPQNQETKCVETPPEPRKGVHQDALGCLGEEASCFHLFVIVYYGLSLRGASQNKIDDDGEKQRKNKTPPAAAKVNKRLRIINSFVEPTANTKTCQNKNYGE